ncbi:MULTISPECIES: GNAT family N-acetyltransferase [Paenibacillus]|uniref:GNAT family N-acetyltransferase n=1 Tax=Paenibacillus TaxID=44249 RepID=UPI002FE10118
MEIVRLQEKDIRTALELVWCVFEEFEAPESTDEGVEAFKKVISYENVIDGFREEELHFWGSKEKGDWTGVIATLGENHLFLLFVKREYHRQGMANRLFRTVEERCRSFPGIQRITVNSSRYAVPFYRRLGFTETGIERTVNGIRFTPMEFRF